LPRATALNRRHSLETEKGHAKCRSERRLSDCSSTASPPSGSASNTLKLARPGVGAAGMATPRPHVPPGLAHPLSDPQWSAQASAHGGNREPTNATGARRLSSCFRRRRRARRGLAARADPYQRLFGGSFLRTVWFGFCEHARFAVEPPQMAFPPGDLRDFHNRCAALQPGCRSGRARAR
jgi:hypothetical protein